MLMNKGEFKGASLHKMTNTPHSGAIVIQWYDEKKYEVKLEGVTSIINLRDKGIVYINSNNATYNKKNHDTFFYGNVKISYLNNSIISENLDLVFSKEISKVYNNVVYNSDQLNLITDKILIDMVRGDIKFRMIDKNNKIKFKTKHEFIN